MISKKLKYIRDFFHRRSSSRTAIRLSPNILFFGRFRPKKFMIHCCWLDIKVSFTPSIRMSIYVIYLRLTLWADDCRRIVYHYGNHFYFLGEYRPRIIYPDPRHRFSHDRHLSQKTLPTKTCNQKLVWPLPLRSRQ